MRLQSRQQRSLSRAFPDLVEALAARVPAGTVLDGEAVVMVDRQLSFPGLQRRLTSRRAEPDAPATLMAFDLLAGRAEDLRALPYARRRERPERLVPTTAASGWR